MKTTKFLGFLSVSLFALITVAEAQTKLSEGTDVYDISIQPKGGTATTNAVLSGAQLTVNLKGSLSRTDMTSNLGTETTIYNIKAGGAAILKEYSGQKLMITLTKENWDSRHSRFDGITFITGTE